MADRKRYWWQIGRPADEVEGTRWLFLWMCVVTVLCTVPIPLATSGPRAGLLAIACTGCLVGSWWLGYRLRRVPVAMDLFDAAAFVGFSLAGPQPQIAITGVFASLWYRSLFGSTPRAVLRGLLYFTTLPISLALWRYSPAPNHLIAPDPGALVAVFPSILLTVGVGRVLARSITDQHRSAQRDAALVELGRRLLGQTDREAISRLSWDAAVELCATLPGVQLLQVSTDHGELRVEAQAGDLPPVTRGFRAGLLTLDPSPASGDGDAATWRVADALQLNAAVGVELAWWVVALPDGHHGVAGCWLLVGAPRRVPTAATAALRGLVNQVTLAYQASHAHRELAAQARTDTLTGLANRIVFTEALTAELASTGPERTERATAVLFIDIDDFKHVNDGLGHQAGDELLQEIARRLRRATRDQDLVARLGGDEFAVILRQTPEELAVSVGSRIVTAISTPVAVSNGVAEVGASVGIAMAEPGDGPQALVRQADVAMYAAKAQGKNRVQQFHTGLLPVDSRPAGG